MSDIEPVYVAVVDDDDNFCRSLSRLLRAAGMQSVTHGSPEAFFADTKHPRFDWVVFDVNLGGSSGIELGGSWRKADMRRFICITSHDEPGVRAGSEAAGCSAFLRKTVPVCSTSFVA